MINLLRAKDLGFKFSLSNKTILPFLFLFGDWVLCSLGVL